MNGSFLGKYIAVCPVLNILKIYLQSLRARNGAECIGSEETGVISEGKLADVIAVEDNPLNEIDTVKRVRYFMKEGSTFLYVK